MALDGAANKSPGSSEMTDIVVVFAMTRGPSTDDEAPASMAR